MSRETTPELSSQEFGSDLGEILDHKSTALSQAQREIEALRDTPEVLAREHQAAYHEVFCDTDAKELLWRAEHMVADIMTEGGENYYLRGLDDDALMIDVIEAYGSVVPDEGLRLLDAMPDGPQKIEALARFGRVTDPIFVTEAREIALRLEKDAGYYHRGEPLFAVAYYGNDDASLDMAYQAIAGAYENPVRVRVDGNPSSDDWRYVKNLCKLAYLGHKPALQDAKEAIIRSSAVEKTKTDHWVEEAALVEYIDELLRRGNIGQRFGIDVGRMARYEATEQAWQNFVLNNKDPIVAVLKEGVDLPTFDSLSKGLNMFQYRIGKSTSLSTTAKTMAYIDEQAGRYADILEQQGLSGMKLAQGESTGLDKKYLHSRADIKAKYDEAVAMLKHNGWGHFIGKGGVQADIASTDREAASNMNFLNRLALLRAMTTASVSLATSD